MTNKDNKSFGIDSMSFSFGVGRGSAEVGRAGGAGLPSEPKARGDGTTAAGTTEESEPAIEEAASPGPFRLLILSELMARPEFSLVAAPPSSPIPVDSASFDEVVQSISPALALQVPDPFGASPLRIELRFGSFRTFRPSELAERVAELRALLDAHESLSRLSRGEINWAALRRELDRALPREAWAHAILAGIEHGASAAAPQAPAGPPAPSKSTTGSGSSLLDSLLAQVDLPSSTASVPEGPPKPAGASSLLSSIARGGQPQSPGLAHDLARALAKVEKAFRSLLTAILHHPEVRRLEAAWRSLKLVVDQIPNRGNVLVEVVPVSAGDAEQALSALIHDQADDNEGAPIDLLVCDTVLSPTAAELERVERWAALTAQLPAPLLVSGSPELLGVTDLAALGRTQRRLSNVDDPRAIAVRAVSSRETARWIAVALNGPLLRGAYTLESARVRGPGYVEPGLPDHQALLFGSPALLVAATIAKAFARNGHAFSFQGPTEGAISGLEVHQPGGDPTGPAIPLEAVVTLDAQGEVARAGMILVGSPINRDTSILTSVPMLYRGDGVSRGGDTAASLTLPDQLFVVRCANGLQQVAAAIPADTAPSVASEVARIALVDLFPRSGRGGPEILAKTSNGQLQVTVRPHHYGGLSLEEVTLGARLGGN